jgi:7,8-dihydro-6-hydroxymethylpterin-pyrophosphokinase
MLIFSKEPGSEEGEDVGGEWPVGQVAQTTFMNKCITIKTFSIQSEEMFSRTLVYQVKVQSLVGLFWSSRTVCASLGM